MKQAKTSKKVVSMLMALTMLIGMMTAVTVSAAVEEWEVVKTINFDDYEVKTEFDGYNDIYTHCTADIVENAEDSSDHELLVYGLNSTGTQHRFNIQGLPLEEGETYKMTFYAKANVPTGVAVNMNTFSSGVTYIGSKALSNDWQPFEIEYTATATTTSGVIVLCTNVLADPNVNQTWIDDIVFSKKVIKPEVTVNVGKGGTVTYGGETVSESETFAVDNGADVTLTVAPESGKYATVTVDGVATEIVNNQITLEDVSADTTVKVLFTENGWENVVYINFDGFGAISDLPQATTSSWGNTTVAVTDSETNSTVSQTTFASTPSRVFNLPAIDWESGATYRLSYDVKASREGLALSPGVTIAGYSDGNKSFNFKANGTSNPTLSTAWQSVSQETNIAEFTNNTTSFNNQMYINATNGQAGDIIYFDNFRIEKKLPVTDVDVTVTVGEGGSVIYEGEAVTEEMTVAKGTEVTLTAVPETGYSISAITVDGEEVAHENGVFSFTVNADTAVNVTFEKVTNDVTVNIENGEGGIVKNGEATVTNGNAIPVQYGENLTLTVTPDDNYTVAVTVNGSSVSPNANNEVVIENVTAATVVTVTFTEKAPVSAGIAKDVTYEQFTKTDLGPTIFVYSKLNSFTANAGELYYGIKLWNAEYPDDMVELQAYDPDTEQPAFAKANAPFAIRVYGKAITEDQTYKIKPFVGETEGDTLSVEFGN